MSITMSIPTSRGKIHSKWRYIFHIFRIDSHFFINCIITIIMRPSSFFSPSLFFHIINCKIFIWQLWISFIINTINKILRFISSTNKTNLMSSLHSFIPSWSLNSLIMSSFIMMYSLVNCLIIMDMLFCFYYSLTFCVNNLNRDRCSNLFVVIWFYFPISSNCTCFFHISFTSNFYFNLIRRSGVTRNRFTVWRIFIDL